MRPALRRMERQEGEAGGIFIQNNQLKIIVKQG